jgi:hypothetical protein
MSHRKPFLKTVVSKAPLRKLFLDFRVLNIKTLWLLQSKFEANRQLIGALLVEIEEFKFLSKRLSVDDFDPVDSFDTPDVQKSLNIQIW